MGTLQSTTEPLRVAIIASSARQKLNLKSILESNSVCVIPEDALASYLASAQSEPVADVLLVDLDETDEQGIETLDALIEKSKLPILYNDSAATRNQFSANGLAWGRRLAEKLLEMALAGSVNAVADSANNGTMPVICQAIDGRGSRRDGSRERADKDGGPGLQAEHGMRSEEAGGRAMQATPGMEELGQLPKSKLPRAIAADAAGPVTNMGAKAMSSSPNESGSVSSDRRAIKARAELADDGRDAGGRATPGAIADDIDLKKYQSKLARARVSAGVSSTAKSAPRAMPGRAKHEGAAAPIATPERALLRESADLDPDGAEHVWILGASLGGPQAVKLFLSALPAGLPVGFILAQHIGNHFVPLLAEQFDRICPLKVMTPRAGHLLRNGELVVSPVNRRMVFSRSGHVALRPVIKKTKYAPSIDQLLVEAAYRFGPRAGAIIFSGMGNDGSQGVKLVTHKGGTVWAQDGDSCIMSSMSDNARATGCVEFSGDPTQLANRLVRFLKSN